MTRLLKPLFHSPSLLLIQSALTALPSVSPHSCSPAPPLPTQRAPVDCSNDPREFEPLQCSSFRTATTHDPPGPAPAVSHCSAPPSLNSSPHEHKIAPHPYSSSSIPYLSSSSHPSSVTPILVHLEPSRAPQTQSPPQPHFPPLSQPLLHPSGMASHPPEPLLNLQEVEWGQHATQLTFIDEGQQPV